MLRAFLSGDPVSEGLFYVAVKTTGIFCRPTCSARKPHPRNIEFFATTNHTPTPDGILVLDAKYTHIGHLQKLAELAQKYGRIGDPRTGRVLSRHVWALTPVEAGHRGDRTHLKSFATTDNLGFWSADFDAASPVNGALETRPTRPGAYDPLRQFLAKLLRHAGIDWQDGSGETE